MVTRRKTTYSMCRGNWYGQYTIIKTTPTGKVTKKHSTDSQAWDDLSEDKCSQARLKRLFNQ